MRLDLGPARARYVAPAFGAEPEPEADARLRSRMRRPMVLGAAVIAVFVVGVGLWASLTPLASGITAPGQVAVESSRKTIRHKETATVRQILVKEGQLVRAGQPLVIFDDTDAKATVDVLQNEAANLEGQVARLSAEATMRPSMQIPPDLAAQEASPAVASMIQDQQFLFTSHEQLFQSQMSVLQQRLDQIQNQIRGDQAQLQSINEQRRLALEEMAGYQTLYKKGFAPKTLILRYQGQVADLEGRKGSTLADVARLQQQMGEARMQMASLRDQRSSQAAEQLQDAQSKLDEVTPKLVAARQALQDTVVRAPVDGYVFNLTQFTPGGVAGAGEVLMDIVPSNSPLIVTVMIRPQDIEQVHVGMDARVRLVGPNPRWENPLPAKVTLVSADKLVNDKTGAAYYRADLSIDPKDLQAEERKVKITPGMPATAMIVTGERTIMGFLISPITDTIHNAFREP